MAETNEELLDYEEQEDQDDQVVDGTAADATARRDVRGTYVSIHSSGFRDFLLKPELLRAIVDCGFEHPSEGLFLCLLQLTFSLLHVCVMQILGVGQFMPRDFYNIATTSLNDGLCCFVHLQLYAESFMHACMQYASYYLLD